VDLLFLLAKSLQVLSLLLHESSARFLFPTAAHCVQPKESQAILKSTNLRCLLGSLNLEDEKESSRVSRDVSKVWVHPGWNYQSTRFDDDIVVLVLKTVVEFSNSIQPICLLGGISSSEGEIAGWGKNAANSNIHESIPSKLKVAIINTNEECYRKNFILATIGWEKSFCGETSNAKVCAGDSGSGLVVIIDGVYYLKGILSSSDSDVSSRCTANNLAIYADVPKYLEFIVGDCKSRLFFKASC
jgi:hypothetical protein